MSAQLGGRLLSASSPLQTLKSVIAVCVANRRATLDAELSVNNSFRTRQRSPWPPLEEACAAIRASPA